MKFSVMALLFYLFFVTFCIAAPFKQDLSLQGITFHVSSANEGSINKISIIIEGLKSRLGSIQKDIDGTVAGAEIADLKSDGSPEIYIYTTSAGSGSYGNVIGVSINRMKSASDIYMPPITDDKKLSDGYMGHDEFSIIESSLGRRFPIYKVGDTNNSPTGGVRQIEYKLTAGEAGWVLRIKKSVDFKQ